MGTLVRMNNATNLDIAVNIKKYLQVKSVNGDTYVVSSNYAQYPSTIFTNTWGTTFSSAGSNYLFPYASSDSNITASQTSITNQIGNCSIVYTASADNKGWIANITIAGSSNATVNSLLLTRQFYSGTGGYATNREHLLFAYILDNPITLNADNNYTANLTMSVSFE